MMPRYQDSVQITQGSDEYKGRYRTDSDWSAEEFVYYLNGKRADTHIHFGIVEHNGGTAPPSKFHITVPLQREGSRSVANLHINYKRQLNGTVDRDNSFPREPKNPDLSKPPFNGTTIDKVSEIYESTARQYLTKNNPTLDNVAQEFANAVWR